MSARRLLSLVVVVCLGLGVFATSASAREPVTITLMTHDSFNVSKSVLRAFTRSTGIKVRVLRAGDAGQALNQAILTKDHPLADVLYGIDNTFLSRGLANGIFEPYRSAALDTVPAVYDLDARHRVTPIDRSYVCVNDDTRWFSDHNIARPTTLEGLARPEYRGLLVVENPATSSTGLPFLLATVAEFGDTAPGEGGWRDYWAQLRANDVLVVDGWEQAWYEHFTAGAKDGDRPLVVSYASSPPATVNKAGTSARAGTLLESCFEQVEFAGVLRGTEHRRGARKLIDFMLSKPFQEDVPEQMYVFPVRDGAVVPPAFAKFAQVPDDPLTLSADLIDENRERWIREWTEIVLR
ncbi:MAG: thiamine ABC transporter substrate-binding protein [Acidimicrobiia bacterium]|nr:thiamine ABC transporter substrate-binding protein [Acidimicrobiia bacterium]